MTRCYPWDGQRYTHGQHQPRCTGAGPDWHPPLPWIDCDGCKPCTHHHCAICTRTHLDDTHPQTCTACLDQTRTDLSQIMQLAALAEHRLAHWWTPVSPGTPTDGGRGNDTQLPGGDLLAIVGPGSPGDTDPANNPDDRHDDPGSIAGELAGWEDWWRRTRQQPANPASPTLSRVMGYLTLHLTWAAQHDGQFADFAAAANRIRGRLEAELRDASTPMRGVACFDCGTTLVRPLRDAAPCRHIREARRAGQPPGVWIQTLASYPELGDDHTACDQGGLEDSWRCPRCRRVYDDREYWFAVRAAISDEEATSGDRTLGRPHRLHRAAPDRDRTG